MIKTAKLVLENGTIFTGASFGASGETIGEVCFNTGMTGYQEILTDPSYCGQLVTMTYPHIGNYGVNLEDVESNKIQAAGFIVREESVVPSNFRSTQSLGEYLQNQKIVGIQEIDTRMLTRILRDEGAMNGIISTMDLDDDSLLKKVKAAPSMDGLDLAKVVTCDKSYEWSKGTHKIAAIDFGIKHNILRLLESHGCEVTVFPVTTTAREILEFNPDGVFLSNGPGDPAAVTYAINMVKELLGKKPIFGICLGHQILALALDAKTYKLKFGHRGCNHPVKNLETGIVEITSQNHGFAVDENSLPKNIEVTHLSLNDQTVEGLKCIDVPAFSVQYHPESSPGPHDSRYLFEQFINMITEKDYA
ncbi:MAG: glutamine-hydrolyzing carbamoyl-phosphate synthase small subunit [Candidatus Marinimicrobia bacterium]|nr:glutamine-hydrolyzing carbamoyl-phosphate synthase small subunit [Candidatus Neomarinimicrobiota bacterium]MBT6870759.1 glutamine-hydrolyzing carbamoyl-phosphate synthase small subunit [Candidatus Neomarinimicrobiota bacterium]MBT7377037.1 glutamine-hydrolyzing carbamoyl-phosphate synthase small subunit [Candidatus Neomarinimicrobiota bacterium]